MTPYDIPFNRPSLSGNELVYIEEALRSGHIAGDGAFTKKCNAFLEQTLGVSKALLTTSCTHALEMCALLLEVSPGDEIIVPSFSFVTTANAFVLRGAKPVFIDIRRDTLNCDESQLEGLITSKTKAIVVLHYAGVGCEMDAIQEIADSYGITLIEDSAHGLFGKYKGQYLGSFGALATQSFHETKNVTCGEGGALLINEKSYLERAEILREKGTNRSKFFRGEVDKYTWVDLGSSYLPSDILAAFLFAQFESAETIQKRRQRMWEFYAGELAGWAERNGIGLPHVPIHCDQSYHMFYLLCPTVRERTLLIEGLQRRGIQSVFHFIPLHLSKMGANWHYKHGDFPVTEEMSDRLLRLPFYNDLNRDEQQRVCGALFEAYEELQKKGTLM